MIKRRKGINAFIKGTGGTKVNPIRILYWAASSPGRLSLGMENLCLGVETNGVPKIIVWEAESTKGPEICSVVYWV